MADKLNGHDIDWKPNRPVAEFVDDYGERRVIHRNKKTSKTLSVFREATTPTLRMNRAVAVLLGQNIRTRRLALNLSPRDLCERAGLIDQNPKQRVHAMESAARREGIRLGTLYALAHALECLPGDLLPPMADVLELAGAERKTVQTIGVAA